MIEARSAPASPSMLILLAPTFGPSLPTYAHIVGAGIWSSLADSNVSFSLMLPALCSANSLIADTVLVEAFPGLTNIGVVNQLEECIIAFKV